MFSRKKFQAESVDYWISYSDLMAAVMMIIILFLFVAILNYNTDKGKLAEQEVKLQAQQERIEELVGMKKSIIVQLIEAFAKSDVKVEVDRETGDIRLSSGVFFDSGSYQLKSTGKEFLSKFLPIYLRVLLDQENIDNISEIIIEGHTDDVGGYMYNLELSQKRALEVSRFIYSNEFEEITGAEKRLLETMLTSNGRSFSQIVYTDNKIDQDASRRVEFRFRLKDTEVIKEIDNIIKGGKGSE